MINAKLTDSLTDAIEAWANENCETDWWLNGVGYVSPDMSARLATICALVLQESREAQLIAVE